MSECALVAAGVVGDEKIVGDVGAGPSRRVRKGMLIVSVLMFVGVVMCFWLLYRCAGAEGLRCLSYGVSAFACFLADEVGDEAWREGGGDYSW